MKYLLIAILLLGACSAQYFNQEEVEASFENDFGDLDAMTKDMDFDEENTLEDTQDEEDPFDFEENDEESNLDEEADEESDEMDSSDIEEESDLSEEDSELAEEEPEDAYVSFYSHTLYLTHPLLKKFKKKPRKVSRKKWKTCRNGLKKSRKNAAKALKRF